MEGELLNFMKHVYWALTLTSSCPLTSMRWLRYTYIYWNDSQDVYVK